MNINEQYEKDIEQILQPLKTHGLGYRYDYLLDELQNKYKQTNYPGYLYYIGQLYEFQILKSPSARIHEKYYSDAANQSYLPALLKQNKICLDNIDYEITLNTLWFNQTINHQLLIQDPYGKYLLAKINMIKCINDNSIDEYFMGALSLMKESANESCEEAIRFIQEINIDGINKVIQD